jgi:hypothetical protein
MIARYELVWLMLAVVAVGNGILREATYGRPLGGLAAHQLSTVLGIAFTGLLVFFVSRYWPIRSPARAWSIGILWLVQTVMFEFLFGHYVAGHAWERLFADYDLLEGRLWGLFLLWILVMPYLFYRIGGGRS